jgi:hypothetical protein
MEGFLCVPLTVDGGQGLNEQWSEAIVVSSKEDPNLKKLLAKYEGQWYFFKMMYRKVTIYLPEKGGKSRKNRKSRRSNLGTRRSR